MVGSPQDPRRVAIPQVQGVLVSADFPLDRDGVVARAAEHGADDSMLLVLGRLPASEYDSPAAVLDAVRALEPGERQGVDRPSGPRGAVGDATT